MASADPKREKGDRRKDDEEEEKERKRQQPRSHPGEPEDKEDSRKKAPEKDTPPFLPQYSQHSPTRSRKKRAHRSRQHSPPGKTPGTTGNGTSDKAQDPHTVVLEQYLHFPRAPSPSRPPNSPTRRYRGSEVVTFDEEGSHPQQQRSVGAERGIREMPRWWEDRPVPRSPLPPIPARVRQQVNENIQQDLAHRRTRESCGKTRPEDVSSMKTIIDTLPFSPASADDDFPHLSLVPSVSLRRATPLPDTKLQYQTCALESQQSGGEGSASVAEAYSPGKNDRGKLGSRSPKHPSFSSSSFAPQDDKKTGSREAGDTQQGSPSNGDGDDSQPSETEDSNDTSSDF